MKNIFILSAVIAVLVVFSGCGYIQTPGTGTMAGEAKSVQTGTKIQAPAKQPIESDWKESFGQLDDKINFMAARMEDIQKQSGQTFNLAKENENELKQQFEELKKYSDGKASELGVRIAEVTEIQDRLTDLANSFNENFNIINRNIASVQSDLVKFQKFQENFKAQIEKNFAEERLLANKEIESVTNEKMKIFLDELTRQAEKISKLENSMAEQSRTTTAMDEEQKGFEKKLNEELEGKFKAVLDELAKQQAKITELDKNSVVATADTRKAVDARVDKTYKDIEVQLKDKFALIVGELVKHEGGLVNMDKRLSGVEKVFSTPAPSAATGEKLSVFIENEKKSIEGEYAKELEKRMLFYAKIKTILDDISAQESQLAVYRAKINTLESVQVDTSVTQVYVYHIVKPGDTLSGIAEKYRTSVANIMKINKLSTHVIFRGQSLKVPSR